MRFHYLGTCDELPFFKAASLWATCSTLQIRPSAKGRCLAVVSAAVVNNIPDCSIFDEKFSAG